MPRIPGLAGGHKSHEREPQLDRYQRTHGKHSRPLFVCAWGGSGLLARRSRLRCGRGVVKAAGAVSADVAACGARCADRGTRGMQMVILRHSRKALAMEVCTQVPDQTTRDAFKRLSDLLVGPRIGTKATTEKADTRTPVEAPRTARRQRCSGSTA